MQKLTIDAIQQSLDIEDTPKVTIYIPFEKSAAPPHITENQIRFKNLIHQAAGQLEAQAAGHELSEKLCAFLDKSHNDPEFWKDKTRGMLLLAAGGRMELFGLPVDTEEYVAVDDNFHLAPILALLGDAHEYYVLALAQQNPKLYKGDMYGLKPVDADLPASVRQGLDIDEPNQKTENQGSASGSSMNTGWFNGRGGARDPQNIDRLRFFHLIDKQLCDQADHALPLIIAGIDSEVAEFRELSKYPRILVGCITGNHTETRLDELFDKVQPIIHAELISPDHAAVREEYERLQGANPERVARSQEAIQEAAEQGRVDKLLAQLSRDTTDTVQDDVRSVFRISFPETETSKSLNNLAMKVWRMSGRIFSLLPSEMPKDAGMVVARLRY